MEAGSQSLAPQMMEASASPSGASSHATQTGRPSLWSASDQRKLGRLYVYTTLPLKKILDVIQATSPDDQGPGKDSANKKLNALLDKEPRWLHPRTRTDMERRMHELSHSPTRSPDAHSPFGRPHGESVSSNSGPSPSQQIHQNGSYPHYEAMDGIIQNGNHAPPNEPDNHRVSWNDTVAPADMTIDTDQPPPNSSRQLRFNPLLRRSTVMTNSSAVSTTLQRALSEYSNGFVKHVKRVIKRYTMPNNSSQNPSPILETRPSSADSMRGSWVHDENAPPSMSAAPPLPGEFLCIDELLLQQGPCPERSFEHESRNCLCRAAAEAGASCWMFETGLSQKGHLLLQPGVATPSDFTICDVFGNTLLHLLVARDVDHVYILQIVSSGVIDCRQRNSAGQTFLHLLRPSWLADPVNGSGQLATLLSVFHRDSNFFLARDVYGQTFFHALRSKIEDPTAFNKILRDFGIDLYRDAFGSSPKASDADEMTIKPMRRAYTTVMEEDKSPPVTSPTLSRYPSDMISNQARLLEFVTRSQLDPFIEDAYGRNGLHCLAAAVLSDVSLLRKTGQATDEQQPQNKKRKRESSPCAASGKDTDSSKERLQLRETIVHNLLAGGVNVNHYDTDGNTVLMAFVAQLPEDQDYKVPVSILQMLINRGADIHARNRRGETALHIAIRRGRKLAMRTLVQNGANVHVRDANGRSLLDVADEKMGSDGDSKAYMHYEACRAWLSGQGRAVQNPTVVQEWTPATRPVA